MNQNKTPTMEDLTGTKDKKAQAEKFLNVVNAPIIDLMVRYDSCTNRVTVGSFGGQVEVTAIYKIQDMAMDAIRQQEMAVLAKKSDKPATPYGKACRSSRFDPFRLYHAGRGSTRVQRRDLLDR
jgi:hypothetical protein